VLFEVERTTVLGRPALSVRGELDLATAPQLGEAVASLLSQQPRSIVVDLTETSFLDSSGARQLVLLARSAEAAGAALQVVCPRDNHPVRLVVDLLDLSALVPIVESAGQNEGEFRP
jgi:anti-sigma B factor antagonist